jgi:Histidine phosphatase superfamily (branch 1)
MKRNVYLPLMVLLTGMIVSCSIATPNIISTPGTTTTIIIVRHAERDPGLDPPLNEEGRARAQILSEVLRQNGVTAIYTMDAIRNRETAEPIATRLGLKPSLVGVEQLLDTKALAKRLVTEWLSKHSGGVVLWIGNIGSNVTGQNGTLEEIYRLLGGTGTPPNRYQDMHVIVVPEEGKGKPNFVQTIYGPKSSLDN